MLRTHTHSSHSRLIDLMRAIMAIMATIRSQGAPGVTFGNILPILSPESPAMAGKGETSPKTSTMCYMKPFIVSKVSMHDIFNASQGGKCCCIFETNTKLLLHHIFSERCMQVEYCLDEIPFVGKYRTDSYFLGIQTTRWGKYS